MNSKNWTPLIVALSVAVVIAGWYMLSGKSSLDLNSRELQKDGTVQSIKENGSPNGSKTIAINCKNGESYEIVFTQDHQNYDDLVFNACGADGEL
jgi:hypothetical protein